MLVCPTIGDVNIDYLVKVESASFLYCKVTIFLFVIDTLFVCVRGYVETV